MKIKIALVTVTTLSFLALCTPPSFAAEGKPDAQRGPYAQKKAAFMKLKKENPALFKEKMKEHKSNVRTRLMHLKKQDPQKFQQIVQRKYARAGSRLQQLRGTDPQKYNRTLEQRQHRVGRRMQDFQKNHPDRYDQFMQRHQGFNRWWQNRQGPDYNPPGRRGGPGTNWENPPGRQGGPGAGPDRRPCGGGNDHKPPPPGPRHGPGTNWENPPPRQGGPGAGPGGRPCGGGNGGNPPGSWGGPGTNWENPQDGQGGPGASPDIGRHRNRPTFEEWLEKHPNAHERLDRNEDGQIDEFEKRAWHQHWNKGNRGYQDQDNNPPGRRGGPGTNWENPPGRRGGLGIGPDHRRVEPPQAEAEGTT